MGFRAALALVAPALLWAGVAGAAPEDKALAKERLVFDSDHLDGEIVVLPGVFHPREAEGEVLPFLEQNRGLFPGKRVLEIGAGSGISSLYAAQLGAAKVVATDISPEAVENAALNARRLGFSDVLEARLVPRDDMSAYSVIGPAERFDLIFSNPPFALDLDAETNTNAVDTGDLGLSIVDGLEAHLAPGGVALLYYNSNFYHGVMVRYARYRGYRVGHHVPGRLVGWEAAALYNSYLARLLRRQGVDPDAFRFEWDDDEARLRDREMRRREGPPLLPGGSGRHPGWIAIRRD